MAWQASALKRQSRQVARRTIEVSAVMAVMGAAVSVVPPMAGLGGPAARDLTRRAPTAFTRMSAIPSHNGVYRASLLASPRAAAAANDWTVEVQAIGGTPVADAVLALESWMPDEDRVLATRARVTRYLGEGRYQVDGLRFDRRGWWNVRLAIAASAGADSLAFNLVR